MRKRFTGYERDWETDLDFAQARYYGRLHGRFLVSDPLLSSGKTPDPQTWNRYVYSLNNPVVLTDPLGLYVCRAKTKEQCDQFDAALEKARTNLGKVKERYGEKSKQYEKAARALSVYGTKGVDNGVYIYAKAGEGRGRTGTNGNKVKETAANPTGQKITIQFDPDVFESERFDTLIAHEGSHAADGSDWVKSGFADSMNPSNYETESTGFFVQSVLAEARGDHSTYVNTIQTLPYRPFKKFTLPTEVWNESWAKADREALRQAGIDRHLRFDEDYELTPTSKNNKKAFDRKDRF